MRSPLDFARNPQPYQIPLYFPPFPSVINQQPKQSGAQQALESHLRNYQNINAAELKRLRGDLTAYRQESQTIFRQKVAYPRATVNLGDTNSVVSEPEGVPSSSLEDMYSSSSESEGALMKRAGIGAGRLTEPEMTTDTQFSPTDVSDIEGLTSGTSVGKRVSFGDIDLTEPESDFAPRATQSERKARRSRTYVDNASNRKLGRVGKSY